MSKNVIKAVNIVKNYPVVSAGKEKKVLHAVSGVSVEINEGEIFGVVGESGCGKSTLGRSLIRLEDITDGVVEFKGNDITNLSGKKLKPMRKNMQMIFQNPYASFDPKQKIGSALKEACKVHGIKDSEAQIKIKKLLKEVNLFEDTLNRVPNEMSGGQLQRLAIVRALLLDPEFIVADEPVSALDVSVQAQILNLITDLRQKFSVTMMFISHEMTVVRHICDKVAVMYLGKIVEQAKTEELFGNIMHPYTKALMSAIPTINTEAKENRIVLEGDIPSAIELPKGCAFADRCTHCQEICKKEIPPLKDAGNEHFVACHLFNK